MRGHSSFDQMPAAAQEYVRLIEASIGVPVCLVSVGPDREETRWRSPIRSVAGAHERRLTLSLLRSSLSASLRLSDGCRSRWGRGAPGAAQTVSLLRKRSEPALCAVPALSPSLCGSLMGSGRFVRSPAPESTSAQGYASPS